MGDGLVERATRAAERARRAAFYSALVRAKGSKAEAGRILKVDRPYVHRLMERYPEVVKRAATEIARREREAKANGGG